MEIEEKSTAVVKPTGQKVRFITDDDERDCIYDFDPENLSAPGCFFQNALDEVIDDYGDSIETNEKIGILINLVKKLMN
jgi:hypothetical protein